jgi:adiponectin receptor
MALRSQIAETAPFIPPPAPKAPKTTPSCLLTIDQTPAWYERNPFILTGYLPESRSALLCLRGWTFLHNETGNIYTHLIPALISILAHWMLCAYLQENYPDVAWEDRAVLSLYLSGVTTCLGLSTMYHTFMNHSPTVNKRCLKFDYIGILVLIFSSFASGIYFAFYCEPMPRNIYLLMVSFLPFVFNSYPSWLLQLWLTYYSRSWLWRFSP